MQGCENGAGPREDTHAHACMHVRSGSQPTGAGAAPRGARAGQGPGGPRVCRRRTRASRQPMSGCLAGAAGATAASCRGSVLPVWRCHALLPGTYYTVQNSTFELYLAKAVPLLGLHKMHGGSDIKQLTRLGRHT
jgi:hypothetical protein